MRASSQIMSIRTPLFVLAIGEFAILYSALFVGTYFVQGGLAGAIISLDAVDIRPTAVATVGFLSLVSVGLYHFHQRIYFHEMLARVLVAAIGGGAVLVVIISFVSALEIPPRSDERRCCRVWPWGP